MRRFAFLVHPRDREDLERAKGRLPEEEVRRIEQSWAPFEYLPLEFAGAKGSVYVTPLTTTQMEQLPRSYGREKVREAADRAIRDGARVVGLGVMTSVVTWAGEWLRPHVPQPVVVTNGNALTAAVVADQVRTVIGSDLGSARIAIVGGGGSVGLGCARLLARECASLLLLGRQRHRLVAARASLPPHVRVDVSVLLSSLPEADVVILATASSRAVLYAEHLRPGARVFDLTEPSNLSSDCLAAHAEGRVELVRAGKVVAEGIDLSGIDPAMRPGTAYACLAESVVIAHEDRFTEHATGQPSVRVMNELFAAARELGLAPATSRF